MNTDLSALVAELRAMEAKATPGPWSVEYDSCDCGGGYPCDHGEWPYRIRGAKEARPGSIDLGGPTEIGEFVADDAECMVAARNALPALLSALETAQRERELLVKALLALRDVGSGPFSMDPHQHAINVIEANRDSAAAVLSDPLAVELLKEADRG